MSGHCKALSTVLKPKECIEHVAYQDLIQFQMISVQSQKAEYVSQVTVCAQ